MMTSPALRPEPTPLEATYLLPIRRTAAPAGAELTAYLGWVASRLRLVIVDGSPPEIFAAHAAMWSGIAQHLPVGADMALRNGKVRGVLTGLQHVTHERLIVADDDVRYDEVALTAVLRALNGAHVVRPQNYFAPVAVACALGLGRILLNRAHGR